jgi:hypothetical protein
MTAHLSTNPTFSAALAARLVAIATLLTIASSHAAPADDLKSPSQEVRDRAAGELRQSYQPIPEARWKPVIDQIKEGMTEVEVVALLRPHHATKDISMWGGGPRTQVYRLDDEWAIYYDVRVEDNIVVGKQLRHSVNSNWVEPPPRFTGRWVVYYANGQKSYENQYKDGRYDEEKVAFYSEGARCYVKHYTERGAHGSETGYHLSGKVSYQGENRDGKQVGIWKWYDESGNVTSTRETGLPVDGCAVSAWRRRAQAAWDARASATESGRPRLEVSGGTRGQGAATRCWKRAALRNSIPLALY